MIALLLKLARHRAAWGVRIALGVFAALGATSALRYRAGDRAGYARGVSAERSAHARTDSIAKAASDSAWRVLHAQSIALRDSLQLAQVARARHAQRTAHAEGRLAEALAQWMAINATPDTGSGASPKATGCDAVVRTCDEFRAQVALDRTSAAEEKRLLEASVASRDTTIAGEPVRTAAAVRSGITTWRIGHREPSRGKWFAIGAGLSALLTYAVTR
jgi:hypothetical protein